MSEQFEEIPDFLPDGRTNWPGVAAKVLASCKTIDKYFPKPEINPTSGKSTVDAWAWIFSKRPDYPPKLWYAAVGSFYGSEDAADGAKPGVQDIVRHATIQSHREPFKAEMDAIRERRVVERDRMLESGHQKRAALPKPRPSIETRSMAPMSSVIQDIVRQAKAERGVHHD